MSDKQNRQGACLCGAITLTAEFDKTDVGACHCPTCIKWSGGPLMELECGSRVQFKGEQHIQTYASSNYATRGFCKICGSHLFIKDKHSNYGVPPGLFDNSAGLKLNRQVFFDKKPTYYGFSNKTVNIDSDYIYQHHPETLDVK